MSTSKPLLLRRLLAVLDTVQTGFVYCFVIYSAFYLGLIDEYDVGSHMQFLLLLLAVSAPVFTWSKPAIGGVSKWFQIYTIGRASLFIIGLMLVIFFTLKIDYVSRLVFLGFGVLNFIGLVIVRFFLSWWYFRARVETQDNYTKVLIIGSGPRAFAYLNDLKNSSVWGVEVIGCLDPEYSRVGTNCGEVEVLGTTEDVHRILSQEVVDEVVIAIPRSRLNDLELIAAACEEQGIVLRILADFYGMSLGKVSLDVLSNSPILNFHPVSQGDNQLLVKRIIDIVIVTMALPALLPLFLVIGVAIKLESRGPVFFLQKRVGLRKREFLMMKFRSMAVDAEAQLADLAHLNEADGPIFKINNDPRVTRVGRFIRRKSLDELPQLINVFLGHMSIVGPRPMSTRDVDLFDQGVQRKRFSVRPGCVCIREISGRSQLSFDKWLELDLKYIDEWSLGLDFRILLRALPAVLKGTGAS